MIELVQNVEASVNKLGEFFGLQLTSPLIVIYKLQIYRRVVIKLSGGKTMKHLHNRLCSLKFVRSRALEVICYG